MTIWKVMLLLAAGCLLAQGATRIIPAAEEGDVIGGDASGVGLRRRRQTGSQFAELSNQLPIFALEVFGVALLPL